MDTTAIAISIGLPWLATSILVLAAIVAAMMDFDCQIVADLLHSEYLMDRAAFDSNRAKLADLTRDLIFVCDKIAQYQGDIKEIRKQRLRHIARQAWLVVLHNRIAQYEAPEVIYRLTA